MDIFYFFKLFFIKTGQNCAQFRQICLWQSKWRGTVDAEIKTQPPPPPWWEPRAIRGSLFLSLEYRDIALHIMLCLLPGPLAYWLLPFRFILLHFLPYLWQQRQRNGCFFQATVPRFDRAYHMIMMVRLYLCDTAYQLSMAVKLYIW